jgi:hypothetical protein
MADDTTPTTDGQAPVIDTAATQPETAPVAPVPETPTTPDITPTPPSETPEEVKDDFDKPRASALIAKLRLEEKRAKDLDKRVADYERRERDAAEAQLSESERLSTQLKRAEAELVMERQQSRDAINRYEVQAHAARLNIVDPDAAVKLLDWGQLEYDDDGRPSDVEAALKSLIEAKPYLVRSVAPVAVAAVPQTATGNGPTRTQEPGQRTYTVAEISDYPFFRAHRADIQAAMREGRVID